MGLNGHQLGSQTVLGVEPLLFRDVRPDCFNSCRVKLSAFIAAESSTLNMKIE
jgi:hypothetical protein